MITDLQGADAFLFERNDGLTEEQKKVAQTWTYFDEDWRESIRPSLLTCSSIVRILPITTCLGMHSSVRFRMMWCCMATSHICRTRRVDTCWTCCCPVMPWSVAERLFR